jgi:hypothetical protein
MSGIPDGRNSKILQLLIGGADRFLRYLIAMLGDDDHQLSLTDLVERQAGDSESGSAMPNVPVLEAMVRSMRNRPERIVALAPLVADLEEDGALPPGFIELWEALTVVTREQGDDS